MPPKSAKLRHYLLSRGNSVKFCKDFTRDKIFYTNIVGTLVHFSVSAFWSQKCNHSNAFRIKYFFLYFLFDMCQMSCVNCHLSLSCVTCQVSNQIFFLQMELVLDGPSSRGFTLSCVYTSHHIGNRSIVYVRQYI